METLSQNITELELEKPELRLRDAGFDWLTEQLAKLSKKALKLGMEAPTLKVVKEEVLLERDWKENYTQYNPVTGKYEWPMINVRYRTVEVTGETPKLGRWSLVAVVEHTGSGNLLKMFPQAENPIDERFKHTTTDVCDHCNVRRQRNETFVVEDEYGIQMQVGRSCLKDFTGHANPLALANIATMIAELAGKAMTGDDDFFEGGGFHRPKLTDIQDLLAVAVAVIRVDGGYKKANSPGDSTSAVTRELMYPTPPDRRASTADRAADKEWREKYSVLEGDRGLSSEVYLWAKNQPESVTDYMWNVRVLANEGWLVGFRNWGIACSIVHAYLRHMQNVAERPVKPTLPPSEHKGTVGGKLQVENVTILRTQVINSEFGSSVLFVFQDQTGAVYNWFCSGKLPISELQSKKWDTPTAYAEGEVVKIAGTVKRHGEYRDEKVTLLTRVKISA